MSGMTYHVGSHDSTLANTIREGPLRHGDTQLTYDCRNFFHPFVGELIAKLNTSSLSGMLAEQLSPDLIQAFFDTLYKPTQDSSVSVTSYKKKIDVSVGGPYANYNWELFFHIPLTVAAHLSKNQRFAEAQRWFHYIFDPTSNDQNVDPLKRFWKFLAFRDLRGSKRIEDVVRILSEPRSQLPQDEQNEQENIMAGYNAIREKPFQPHAVARTRPLAYQYCVVMKYLDNLIAWGDHLFQQDTVEAINEATQIYVLAANILGERPQQMPMRGTVKAKTFSQLKNDLGAIGNALVDLESPFPFNVNAINSSTKSESEGISAVFGIGRTLYFCIPPNPKLLGYWDTVADRLFKIRHCMNMAGVVRPLALFDPPIDPGMLVKAAGAGLDIGAILSGLNHPIGPVRCLFLIQKALELCGEVRGLGNALLSVIEKREAERLALIRQRHEIQIQQMAKEVRFLQWKAAQEATTSLLTSRKTALERLRNYQRLLDLPADQNAPDTITLDRRELTEENFDEAYGALVGQYERALTLQVLPELKHATDSSSEGLVFGGAKSGRLYLNAFEDAELNSHLPRARDSALAASVYNSIASGFTTIPDAKVKLSFWGLGGDIGLKIGTALVAAARIGGDVLEIIAAWEKDQAAMASKAASYQRRADEWFLQYNLAAHELMQNGRQILTALIAEQISHHEYSNVEQQIKNSQEVDQFLHDKFTNEDLYLWMQGETSRLYYEYYRFAFDTARKAERAMKQELMRPEMDSQDFVKFNYWDGGRKGLLSGETLYLDVKRMEMAYHENNNRELEVTRHVSLRQLDPIALLFLKTTGSCTVTIPEWLFDMDCPGHYMRRIKSVGLSVPCVVGPYTSLNCTLSLLKSSVRKSAVTGDDYTRQGADDSRFVDYIGQVQSVVTSSGQNDSGMFEPNLRDERLLPFEGAGAESRWKIDLPNDYRTFDYGTISDVVLHIRYTARQGVEPTKVTGALENLLKEATEAKLALLFSLPHDLPTEWSAFVHAKDNSPFSSTIRMNHFPYFTQGSKGGKKKLIFITGIDVYDGRDVTKHKIVGDQASWDASTADLNDQTKQAFTVTIPPDEVMTRKADAQVFLIIRYSLS